MYIDSGKDLSIDKIVSPRPDKIGPGANMRTQVPVKQSTKLKTSQVAMKTTGAITAKGEKYA
jgi:hypothetical protein|tara:strand:+ start:177 stop:362 length:186 start_codon:yes stop_codon:yes gene_type:complete